jgi:beta-galactosidase
VSFRRLVLAAAVAALLAPAACSSPPPGQARLRPTLDVRQVDGGQVAFQLGQPVPTFSPQPRPLVDLDGDWRFQAADLDPGLTFADRTSGVEGRLTAEASSRLRPGYDDSGWAAQAVPGTFSPPPNAQPHGGWYRRTFTVPSGWGRRGTLKFQSVGYVADVWLNQRYLGYHEGAWTPFAVDTADALQPGANTLVVRVADPEWGTRLDIVPWGLADWWNYGGITGPAWLEGAPDLSLVRADVSPHLDGADVGVVLQNRGQYAEGLSLITEVLATDVSAANLADPDPRHLVAAASAPVVSHVDDLDPMPQGDVRRFGTAFVIRGADLWTPLRAALYVLRVALVGQQGITDELYETFGLRQVRTDSAAPRLLLNGAPVAFHGVAMHDERQEPAQGARPAGGPVTTVADELDALQRARSVNADFIRADHHPANPLLLELADRMGFAVWEEIPLYHYTPETFRIAMDRGVPQQLLSEMALRDMNHPSVLFHGLANESTGGSDRASALVSLRDLDRRLDGTRLTGQAAYGSDAQDATSTDLDVAGYTFYPGVFYGGPLDAAVIGATLDRFHARYPRKPVMILEFGRWADSPGEEPEQRRVFDVTYAQLSQRFDTLPGGFLGSAVWWTLDDYWTQRPGIDVEHFGLLRPDGSPREVAAAAATAYAADSTLAPRGPVQRVVSGGVGARAGRPGASRQLVGLVGYALALPTLLLGLAAIVLLASGRRRGQPA